MPSYKLTYFDGRGRAEISRYIFAVAGKKYEDCRVKYEDWPQFKPKTPFGSMPLLEVDGKVIAQGNAIARYLAREFGLAGKNNLEQACCDQYMELCVDLFNEVVKAAFEKDEEKKAELAKKLDDETFPKFMGWLQSAVEKNKSGWLVGDKLTIADLAVFSVFDSPMMKKADLMDKYPKLKAHRANVAAKVTNYLKNRKQTEF